MAEQVHVPHTPPWAVAAADQRIAFMRETMGNVDAKAAGYDNVVVPLKEPDTGEETTPQQFEYWERTCDRCGVYVPDASRLKFYIGYIQRQAFNVNVTIVFGACENCAKEGLKDG